MLDFKPFCLSACFLLSSLLSFEVISSSADFIEGINKMTKQKLIMTGPGRTLLCHRDMTERLSYDTS